MTARNIGYLKAIIHITMDQPHASPVTASAAREAQDLGGNQGWDYCCRGNAPSNSLTPESVGRLFLSTGQRHHLFSQHQLLSTLFQVETSLPQHLSSTHKD